MCRDAALRARIAAAAYEKVISYTWKSCAERTFGFLARIARKTGRAATE
jgi:hypothetical protein